MSLRNDITTLKEDVSRLGGNRKIKVTVIEEKDGQWIDTKTQLPYRLDPNRYNVLLPKEYVNQTELLVKIVEDTSATTENSDAKAGG